MSGETVTSKNGLQFTNDNKFCYIYSGPVTLNTSPTIALEFNTNSEYLIAELSINSTAGSGLNLDLEIKLNDVAIIKTEINNDFQAYPDFGRPATIIIPPFTKFTASGGVATTGKEYTFILTGKVGMAPRVGNLVE